MSNDSQLLIPDVKTLNVLYNKRPVGVLALTKDSTIAFEYDADWLLHGFSISPFSLPLERRVFVPKYEPFDGLFGVFSDSLPDGWGRFLLDRMLRKHGVDPYSITTLQRLAIVGSTGMGALVYEPEAVINTESADLDLDELASECKHLLETNDASDLDGLFVMGGSSGGARPKVLTHINGSDWIIKFPAHIDPSDIGLMEYEYAQTAKRCGIDMPEVRLFKSKRTNGYFGVRRFDRVDGAGAAHGARIRIHMLSVSALLETSHRIPSLDYKSLMIAALKITKDFSQVEAMYRLMCFNVQTHNMDDHSRNFSFIYNDNEGRYVLSPAYDLTYSSGMGGEHATSVNGKGKDIQNEDLVALGEEIGLAHNKCTGILQDVRHATAGLADKWARAMAA
ncbi:MAG: type II toxin-antitoxin system HipA family toxin [Coriobacteriales bacterium]|jgi:serine/threonine-protein kinase HipA|nr:type II toxin-antitoxin system HipA family toxin [Coriobacteriales bacterium]